MTVSFSLLLFFPRIEEANFRDFTLKWKHGVPVGLHCFSEGASLHPWFLEESRGQPLHMTVRHTVRLATCHFVVAAIVFCFTHTRLFPECSMIIHFSPHFLPIFLLPVCLPPSWWTHDILSLCILALWKVFSVPSSQLLYQWLDTSIIVPSIGHCGYHLWPPHGLALFIPRNSQGT